MDRKEKVIYVKAGENFHDRVKTAAEKIEKTISEFTRDALVEKLERVETRRVAETAQTAPVGI
jgi:hypothetical protein